MWPIYCGNIKIPWFACRPVDCFVVADMVCAMAGKGDQCGQSTVVILKYRGLRVGR
jgi:hypothetical protein